MTGTVVFIRVAPEEVMRHYERLSVIASGLDQAAYAHVLAALYLWSQAKATAKAIGAPEARLQRYDRQLAALQEVLHRIVVVKA